MDTALPQKFPFILDRNLAKANYTGNRVCTACDTVVLAFTSKMVDFAKIIFLKLLINSQPIIEGRSLICGVGITRTFLL